MEFDCPVCHTQLAVQGNSARCERCAKEYVVEARCPDCHKPLEVLKACGAVDY
ncbi:MAG: zinc-ribbon domain-containing protein, partial [Klebsiella michiganensis]